MGNQTRAAFTLIELMIVVCIIGVLASVALPSYSRFVMQSRGSEGTTTLGRLYQGAAAYWESTNSSRGTGATSAGHCIAAGDGADPGMAGIPTLPPQPYKRTADYSTSPVFSALGYSTADPVYFIPYPIATGAGPDPCSYPDDVSAYEMLSIGDLDGDGVYGGHWLQVGIRKRQLFRAPAFGSLGDFSRSMGGACPQCGDDID